MQSAFDLTADLDTPVSAFLKLAPLQPRFLLESVDQGDRLGRYSFLGFGPAHHVRLDTGGLTLDGTAYPHPSGESFAATMRRALALAPVLEPRIPTIPFHGGLVGLTTYEAVGLLEPRLAGPTPPNHAEDAGRGSEGGEGGEGAQGGNTLLGSWVAPSSVLVFDHVTRRMALLHGGTEAERTALAREIKALLRSPIAVQPTGSAAPAEESIDRATYCEAVGRVQEYIAEGEVFQLVLASRFRGRSDLDPFQVYRALRVLNPSPYLYYVALPDLAVVGSSPEALVRLRDGAATLRPIAGTRSRGDTAREDRELERALLDDPKEAAEHVMLVDLARNDLGRVAEPGTIVVEPYRSVERYSHVMHLVSGVEGRLSRGLDQFDLFAATFPAGTVVGAPKIRAMELIRQLEPVPRGGYAGTVGYFGHGEAMDQAIAIRTLLFEDGHYAYQAGAGIVADSVPRREYQEVLAKGAALAAAIRMAAGGLD